MQFDKSKLKIRKMPFPELLANLGLISKDKIIQVGKPEYVILSEAEIRSYVRSLIRIHYLEKFRKTL